ncbi:MAG: bacterial sensory transduction regulator family protein [Hydrocarboniphaga sp.]|uniref:YbjN domain-containing protein n=1 Tax=Hydrocarboniphaga sp. TaxID=2033016 RepID=UPI00261A6C05|nr:YbjN domain-containing protein [Hydrocarboniphaga sp.]MDB5970438.1 bacterial sensory transduction regulator family protein [Hydrocarboniphaga sp.]
MSLQNTVTPEAIAEALRRTGYRATLSEHQGRPQVRSAAQGIGFFVAFGGADTAAATNYVDFAFHCWINIEGELRPGLIDSWNQTRRFARLFRQGALMVLTMDVLVAGGVDDDHLSAQCELWDRVIQDFIRHLKQEPATATVAAR